MWPICGERWIVVSSAGILAGVRINFSVALLDVAGKQTCPREAGQIDQFERPVSGEEFRNWVRQGRDTAAVISNLDSLLGSGCKPDSGIDWEGRTCGSYFVAARRVHALRLSPDRGRKPLMFRSLPPLPVSHRAC